jgi:hypothetical protein
MREASTSFQILALDVEHKKVGEYCTLHNTAIAVLYNTYGTCIVQYWSTIVP